MCIKTYTTLFRSHVGLDEGWQRILARACILRSNYESHPHRWVCLICLDELVMPCHDGASLRSCILAGCLRHLMSSCTQGWSSARLGPRSLSDILSSCTLKGKACSPTQVSRLLLLVHEAARKKSNGVPANLKAAASEVPVPLVYDYF